jgi:hypothetical protein
MIGSINGYSTTVAPPAPRRDADPAAAAAAAPPSSSPIFPRPNLALLQTMQAGRVTSSLLSSLGGPSDSFLPAPSRLAFAPQTQPPLQRPSLALLETMQEGRQNATLLSSLIAPAPDVRQNGGYAGFVSSLANLTRSQETISAMQLGPPSAADSRIAHKAYLTEIQTKGQLEQWPTGNNWMNEWFA